MGAYSNAMWSQAEQEFSDALVKLFAEWFQRGSDSLGHLPGPAILAETVRLVGGALSLAAGQIEETFSNVPADGA